jgi:hypothetical protein
MPDDVPKPAPNLSYKLTPEPGQFEAVGYAPTLLQTTNGYVALLDVLGFRGIVAADRDNSVIIKYLQTIQRVLADANVETIVFSDSIVLTRAGETSADLHGLVVVCSALMGTLLCENIAMRGAIAYGKFARSQIRSSAFLAGSPIVEAYDYEQRQDWVGMLLTPSALRQAADVDFSKTCTTSLQGIDGFAHIGKELEWKAYLQRADVMFKGSHAHEGFAVVPHAAPSLPGLAKNLNEILERLEWLKLLAPSPSEQSKYINSMRWLRGLRDTWQSRATEYLDWEKKRHTGGSG